jgi:anti-sigma factor RsiW
MRADVDDRRLSDETLMRYLDGELDRDEARRVERAVAASPELGGKARALAQLREVIAARFQAAADEAAPALDAMWASLRAGLDAAREPAPSPARGRSFLDGVREWFESYRSHLVTGALAAAAGALVATLLSGPGRPEVVDHFVYAPPATSVLASAAPAEVESLEVANGTATILQIPGDREDDPRTTVIWLTPNDEGPI